MRLQKYIASAGVCSRREAENRIREGRVTINGRQAQVGDGTEDPCDVICVDGQRVRPPVEHTYVMLHKPRGYVTTLRDDKGRPTVAELVASAEVRLFPVGRLDYDSEGLLILTDDGEAANRLAHPSHGVKKTYHVWVKGDDISVSAEGLRKPVEYNGTRYHALEVKVLEDDGAGRGKLAVTLGEGKNREVRNLCAASGLLVTRLMRVSQGELRLGTLPSGQWRYLTDKEIDFLHNST